MRFSALFLLPVGLLLAQAPPDAAGTARKAVELFFGDKTHDLFQMFSPDLQKALPEASLPKIAEPFKAMGAVSQIGTPEVRKAGAGQVASVPVTFSGQSIRVIMSINSAGQLVTFVPQAAEIAWQRPSYSKPDSFREQNVTVGEGEWALSGTLTLPTGNGPFPAVVLVHGSGPNDRDESVGGTKIFRDLAEGLASRGIAVLRYNKRTFQYRAKTGTIRDFTINQETVEDAVKAAALLRAQKEIDPRRIYVLGHDLGGYIAPRIAEEDEKLAGMIVLAGNVRPIEDQILEQSQAVGITGTKLEALKAQAARVKALEPADAGGPAVMGMPVSYLLDLKGYNPAEEAAKLTLKILVLQGERDFQVSMSDFALWKAAVGNRKNATLHSYPSLNHLFVAGEGKSTEAEYRKPGHVAPEVIDEVAKWITS
jgi:dienelactone hydrolase